ncbi:MAG: AzlC family ABC transporter permease [Chloroflexi bacterium]|nr:AzlC family ABC transporter permease [Chloroflexota bacterium]
MSQHAASPTSSVPPPDSSVPLTAAPAARPRRRARADFWRGYLALLPLWTGAIPAGVAFGVAARSAGLSVLETQLMSLTVFSAAGQIGAVSLLAAGASAPWLVGTVLALNAQLLLLGLAVGRQLRLSWPQRLLAAWVLTDGAYGVSLGVGPLRLPVLLGAGASMYSGWNLGTILGAVLGAALPSPTAYGINLVAPLAFLAVLVPLVRTRPMLLVALAAGLTTYGLSTVVPGGVAVLGAGVVGCTVGAWLTRHEPARGAAAR